MENIYPIMKLSYKESRAGTIITHDKTVPEIKRVELKQFNQGGGTISLKR